MHRDTNPPPSLIPAKYAMLTLQLLAFVDPHTIQDTTYTSQPCTSRIHNKPDAEKVKPRHVLKHSNNLRCGGFYEPEDTTESAQRQGRRHFMTGCISRHASRTSVPLATRTKNGTDIQRQDCFGYSPPERGAVSRLSSGEDGKRNKYTRGGIQQLSAIKEDE